MPIVYKINVLSALKEKGYNTNRIRKEKIFGEATLQHFRKGEMVSLSTINDLCRMLDCQPGDILEYISDESDT